jgi:phosphoglycerate dehydrogenase-like enzyme
MTDHLRIAILDDSQRVARASADWSVLEKRAEIIIFSEAFVDEDDAASRLRDFDIIVPMRERTPFPASLINKLPRLKFIALTGGRAPSLDLGACVARGILVSNTSGDHVTAATAELAWALILACARNLPDAHSGMRNGGWHEGRSVGVALAGKRIGIVGLGKLGKRVARYANAFDMDVVAWSQNLTSEAAAEAGAHLVSKTELFSTADVVSLHLVLSERTKHIVGGTEILALKAGAILVNTSRGPLIDSAALLERLRKEDIFVGLDVYDQEPLAPHAIIRTMPNAVVSPHLGYSTQAVFTQFYQQAVENIEAYLSGNPIRLLQS